MNIQSKITHKELFYELKNMLKYDSSTNEYYIDFNHSKHDEIKQYFRFKDVRLAELFLKVWLKKLEHLNIEDETNEDAMLEFFQLRYFLTNMNYDLIRNGNSQRRGLGNSNKE
jgi:hypothetical protein